MAIYSSNKWETNVEVRSELDFSASSKGGRTSEV